MTSEKYTYDLLVALRLREVPGDRIGEVIAEVESHVAETGEDPREAFGTPKEYAKTISPGKTNWFAPRLWALVAIGWIVGSTLSLSLIAIAKGDETLYGLPLPSWLWLLFALAMCAVWIVNRHKLRDVVVDPRSGEDMVSPAGPAVVTAFIVLIAASVIFAALIGYWD